MSEKKKEIEVKEPEKTPITPWRPGDVFQAFDEMWNDFRRDFLVPWRPWRRWIQPWRRTVSPLIIVPREACVDLVDMEKEYKVCAEVPGIPKDKIDVTITTDGIEISGKAEVEKQEEEQGYVVRERGYSEVYKKLSFPEEVAPEKATATLKDGVLEVKIPKKTPAPKAKKHKVKIK